MREIYDDDNDHDNGEYGGARMVFCNLFVVIFLFFFRDVFCHDVFRTVFMRFHCKRRRGGVVIWDMG